MAVECYQLEKERNATTARGETLLHLVFLREELFKTKRMKSVEEIVLELLLTEAFDVFARRLSNRLPLGRLHCVHGVEGVAVVGLARGQKAGLLALVRHHDVHLRSGRIVRYHHSSGCHALNNADAEVLVDHRMHADRRLGELLQQQLKGKVQAEMDLVGDTERGCKRLETVDQSHVLLMTTASDQMQLHIVCAQIALLQSSVEKQRQIKSSKCFNIE